MSTLSKSKIFHALAVQEKLQELGKPLFTPNEFVRFFDVSPQKAKYFLETYTKRGLFIRIKKGLYALKNNFPREEVIANALYKPSYISLEYALARYGIIPEMPYTITSATTRVTIAFDVRGKEFSFTKIKNKAFTGYTPEKAGNYTVFMAEPEKALVDYLYLVSLGKKTLNDRIDLGRINKNKAREYARLFERKGLMRLINSLYKQ